MDYIELQAIHHDAMNKPYKYVSLQKNAAKSDKSDFIVYICKIITKQRHKCC